MSNLALNQNQFTQSPILGMLTQDEQPDTLTCQINPAGTLVSIDTVEVIRREHLRSGVWVKPLSEARVRHLCAEFAPWRDVL